MVDFPNNPVDGDTHTEEGTTWVYRDPPSAWAVVSSGTPASEEFHDPTGLASWRITGNTLECWGTAPGSDGTDRVVTFPKTFARPPRVTAMVDTVTSQADDVVFGCAAHSIAVTAFTLKVTFRSAGGSGGSTTDAMWHAIGEWDGIS